MPLYLQFLVFSTTVLFVVAICMLIAGRKNVAVQRRLGLKDKKKKTGPQAMRKMRKKVAGKHKLAEWIVKFAQANKNDSEKSALRKKLILAGYRSDASVAVFTGCKTALAVLVPTAVTLMMLFLGSPMKSVAILDTVCAIIGMRLPHLWLGRKIKKRQLAITCSLPDALDLMVVCVEAGLGLDAAIQKVGNEIVNSSQDLGEELCLVNAEIRIGRTRPDALRELAERTGVEDVKSFAARLIQADKFGTSIAQSLRVHAEMLRNKRKQRAEEAAAKTTVKLLFPLVFFIFPSLFVVILGPAAINIIRAFS